MHLIPRSQNLVAAYRSIEGAACTRDSIVGTRWPVSETEALITRVMYLRQLALALKYFSVCIHISLLLPFSFFFFGSFLFFYLCSF
jgi:hypothetical protein